MHELLEDLLIEEAAALKIFYRRGKFIGIVADSVTGKTFIDISADTVLDLLNEMDEQAEKQMAQK